MRKRPWMMSELRVIRQHYPVIGTLVYRHLTGRTRKAISHKAQEMGLVADRRTVQILRWENKRMEKLCRHCHWSEWSADRQQLIGMCQTLRGGPCRPDAHECGEFVRAPGADDDVDVEEIATCT